PSIRSTKTGLHMARCAGQVLGHGVYQDTRLHIEIPVAYIWYIGAQIIAICADHIGIIVLRAVLLRRVVSHKGSYS
ncbi:MAG: hypothetical protein V3U31_05885, partial [Dehalococcoidia bacterium]